MQAIVVHWLSVRLDQQTAFERPVYAVPADRLQVDLLSDDRLLRFGAVYRRNMYEQVDRIVDPPRYFWERCSAICKPGFDSADLHPLDISAVFITIGYIYKDVFKQFV